MRLHFSALCLLLHAVGNVLGQSPALAGLPECGLACLIIAIGASNCAATNQTCVCLDEKLQANATACITASCTVKQSLVVKNATENACGAPIRSRSEMYSTISTTFGVISGTVVLLRIASKFVTNAQWGWDDTLVCAVIATGIPTSVLVPHGLTSNGLGRDIWTVTPKRINNFLATFYVVEVLYFAQVALLKLSLLFFYLRIFPGPKIRRFIIGTIIFDICFGIAFVLAGTFQCRPISYFWKNWDGEHEGSCVNVNVLGWSNAGISIVLDAWMFSIPVSQLIGLQMHWKKKVGVIMMFLVGTFITVMSIIRLQSLVHFASSTNATWDNLPVGVWSTIEINVGIICVSMPSLRLLLIRVLPKAFGTTDHTKHQYYINGSHNHQLGNISVGKPSKSFSSTQPKDKGGIVYSQTYTVQYDNRTSCREADEAELIETKSFKTQAMKSDSQISDESV